MGLYIDPLEMSKEAFLEKNGLLLQSAPKWGDFLSTSYLPVCLVNNPDFSAALVCRDEYTLTMTTDPADTRPKKYYMVRRELLEPYIK